ncbi:MAG: ABC transporter substrate-binding protein [Rhodobacteraceae bacterium]|nr:ABC transporter substrate-binding protein [Paracoccaceae bacterium]
MIPRRTFTLSAMAIAAAAPARADDWQTDPSGYVSKFAETGITQILEADIPQSEKSSRFRTLFGEFFDIPAIGRFVLGRFARAAKPDDLDAFQKLFEDVIVYTWTRRFSEYQGQTLNVQNSSPDGNNGAVVNSAIIDKNGQSFAVAWRLRMREQGYRIVDIIIEGVSMAITYRQEYATVIQQNGGMSGLLTQMRKQVSDLEKQSDT